MANVKFLQGTREAFDALQTYDINTFYLVGNSELYIGNNKLTSDADVKAAVARLDGHDLDIKALEDAIAELTGGESSAGSIASQLATLKTELQGYADDAVDAEKVRAEGAESALQGQITTLQQTVTENESDIEGKFTTLNGTVAGHTTTLGEHSTSITNLQGAIDSVEEILQGGIDAVDKRVDDLLGDDTEPTTIRAIAEDAASKKVDAVIDGAPESFNTLKEIADWINNDETGAASISATVGVHEQEITQLQTDVGGLQTTVETQGTDISGLKSTVQDHGNRIGVLETASGEVDGKIAAAKKEATDYTDTEIKKVTDRVTPLEGTVATQGETLVSHATQINDNATNISTNTQSIASNTTAIANAQGSIDAINQTLRTFKSAAFETKEYFEGLSTTAENNAKAYTDTCLTWNPIAQA